MKTRIWMGTLAVLILIAGFFGIGYLVYQAGVAQGSSGLDPAVTVWPMFASQSVLTAHRASG